MLKPFYQGKLDSFCAIYAVLNCLRLVRGLRGDKARNIFNDALCILANSPDLFRAVVKQDTDYMKVVDTLLGFQANAYCLTIDRPYSAQDVPDPQGLQDVCKNWLEGDRNRAVILRFMRYVKPGSPPVNRHWTTVDKVDKRTIHLFDSSHEAEAVLNIASDSFVTRPSAVEEKKLIYIQPDSLRLVGIGKKQG